MTGKQAIDDLVERLREANQHLVIATVRAQRLQAEAETANQRQKEFLCMLAHELHNPLTPLTSATQMLGMVSAVDSKLSQLHGVIARQVSGLTRLVGDLLDASRVSSGKFGMKIQPLFLSEIIEYAIETSQPVLDNRSQHLRVDLPAEPLILDGDFVRLGQVFSNLLINAAKFTPECGHIVVSAVTTPNGVTVSVKDDGIGISAELQPLVFDLFAQGARMQGGAQGGLGIGLSLVRTIVEMHGGTVEVHSDGLLQGSEFTVRLPLGAASLRRDTEPVALPPPRQVSRRILIIGDLTDMPETLETLFSAQGHVVTLAHDGPTGLLQVTNDHYDVIICDCGLAETDEHALIRQLRSQATERALSFIALARDGSQAEQARALAAGFDHYLIMPVDATTLSPLLFPKAGGDTNADVAIDPSP